MAFLTATFGETGTETPNWGDSVTGQGDGWFLFDLTLNAAGVLAPASPPRLQVGNEAKGADRNSTMADYLVGRIRRKSGLMLAHSLFCVAAMPECFSASRAIASTHQRA